MKNKFFALYTVCESQRLRSLTVVSMYSFSAKRRIRALYGRSNVVFFKEVYKV